MSRKKTTYSTEFKTKLVLELLKGEKTIQQIAIDNNVLVKNLQNWKAIFLANAEFAMEPLQNNELASVYLDSRYPGDMGLLPNGKPTIGEAKEFYCFALYIYDRICNILKIDKSELI